MDETKEKTEPQPGDEEKHVNFEAGFQSFLGRSKVPGPIQKLEGLQSFSLSKHFPKRTVAFRVMAKKQK